MEEGADPISSASEEGSETKEDSSSEQKQGDDSTEEEKQEEESSQGASGSDPQPVDIDPTAEEPPAEDAPEEGALSSGSSSPEVQTRSRASSFNEKELAMQARRSGGSSTAANKAELLEQIKEGRLKRRSGDVEGSPIMYEGVPVAHEVPAKKSRTPLTRPRSNTLQSIEETSEKSSSSSKSASTDEEPQITRMKMPTDTKRKEGDGDDDNSQGGGGSGTGGTAQTV